MSTFAEMWDFVFYMWRFALAMALGGAPIVALIFLVANLRRDI